PATVQGSAAADLAHLLAELIENALVFSSPDQAVDIRGRNRPDGGYTLAIIDSGLGMAPEDIAAANRRLAGAESFTVAPSKYLGHYVAGNLAARHGIQVRLDNSPGNGITATVDLPPTLLSGQADTAGAEPRPGPVTGGRPPSPAPDQPGNLVSAADWGHPSRTTGPVPVIAPPAAAEEPTTWPWVDDTEEEGEAQGPGTLQPTTR